MNATGAYRQSRDQLLHLRGEHARAVAEFRWPEVGTRFNWAVDWFDAIANGNDRRALVVVEEDGSATERTFAEMSRASDRLSSWLAARGVHKGDPVLLMLGNQVELWETMLAIMKLGAVILPTTTAVGPADLGDRIARSRVRHVICNAADTGKFDRVHGDYTRISVGAAEGWSDLRTAAQLQHTSVAHPGTTPDDPLLLYFTSGTTSRPKLVFVACDRRGCVRWEDACCSGGSTDASSVEGRALRGDPPGCRARMSARALYHVGRRTVIEALVSAWPQPRKKPPARPSKRGTGLDTPGRSRGHPRLAQDQLRSRRPG